MLFGDFNVRVGNKKYVWFGVLGLYGYGKENFNGLLLFSFCVEENLVIINIVFKYKDVYKVIWMYLRSKYWYLFDYIIIR